MIGRLSKPEPQVPAHPGLRASEAPDGNSFPRAQQRSENHECKSDAAERQPRRRAAHGSLRRRDMRSRRIAAREPTGSRATRQPALMCVINAHDIILPICCKSRPGLARFSDSLPQRPCEKFARLHAMRGVVRARIDATGLRLLGAQIAGGRFFLHHGLFLPGMLMIFGLRGRRNAC